MRKLLYLLLALSILLTACKASENGESATAPESTKVVESEVPSGATVLDLKKKYGSEQEKAIMPIYNVEQDKEFIFDFNFELSDADLSIKDLVSIHTDQKVLPESQIMATIWHNVKEKMTREELSDGKTSVSVKPFTATLATDTMRQSTSVWGGAPIYYIRINYDMDATTATKLEKPLVIPFTVKSDLPVPTLQYEIDTTGRLLLSWNEVEGAESYRVYKRSRPTMDQFNLPQSSAEEGYIGPHPMAIAEVTETQFNDFMQDGDGGLQITEALDEINYFITAQNRLVQGEYYVTAVAGDKESGFSKPVDTVPLSKRLPTKMMDSIVYQKYATVKDLPETVDVKYIDGSIAPRRMHYWTEEVVIEGNGAALIKHTTDGTAFVGYVSVNSFTQEELDALSARTEKEANGYVPPSNTTDHVPDPTVPTIITDTPSADDEVSVVTAQKENTSRTVDEGNAQAVTVPAVVADVPVNADSALEEYLALGLIDGQEELSLKAFPEAQNFDTLTDVLQKVVFQNPMILGVKQYAYDYKSLTLFVAYEDDRETIARKQQEIVAEAAQLVASIFKEGMSEEEKHLALYEYLNDNTVYDDAALEEAEKNGFKTVDPKFNDSFTTYGIMVKKVGVCASYASTYKMLSDLAGLESVVVTGDMNGVPHAWNKAKIGGSWVHVDATNNATNSGIPFLLYGASDDTALALNFYLDEGYWLDHELDQFASTDNSMDYYVVKGLEVNSANTFASKVAELLQSGDDDLIVVRMTEALSDNELKDSLIKAFDQASVTDLSNVQIGSLGTYYMIQR
ncbi:transglutaminase domain-containing protein [Paenibacillus pinisoli]|uniref:Transglutaminase domain-containing protein n=1 Tax=Paenibacillus pinisoli TaxID=1276110 RepID=A0A3A6PEI4_9BACL|nr:transglutaminase-like domain-containing protein [Paenibacillus pinisoli]RJX39105.1 transglutaminase domain-containing protein [Paenibacillus pinisoli]